LVCFWCSLKYTNAMNLNFGYVTLYSMSRFVAKVCMILICIFSYDLFKLYARLCLMLFIASLMNFSWSTSAP
jgi:hypothetical protein